MATCIQCQGSKKKKVFISELYCDVCGFGFLREPENKGHTCREHDATYKGVVLLAPNKQVPAAVVEGEEVVVIAHTPTPSSIEERVYEVIKDHPLIGKQEIMKLAQVSEGEYTEAKDSLLHSKKILQEGERRGAKYKAA